MKTILIIFTFLFFVGFYKYFSNSYYLKRITEFEKIFLDFLEDNKNIDKIKSIIEIKYDVIDLFKKSNINDVITSIANPLGYGIINTFQASSFEAFPNISGELPAIYLNLFNECKGVFKSRKKEVFSLFFWLDLIIFMPKHIIKYLGFNSENKITKFLNVLYWLISILVIPVFEEFYISIVKDFIKDFNI